MKKRIFISIATMLCFFGLQGAPVKAQSYDEIYYNQKREIVTYEYNASGTLITTKSVTTYDWMDTFYLLAKIGFGFWVVYFIMRFNKPKKLIIRNQ